MVYIASHSLNYCTRLPPLPPLPPAREINKPTDKNERKYILFDSDVDTLWVESMNSVMDDNKLLTLANGERIRLQKHCALLVEVSGNGSYRYMYLECAVQT